MKTFDLEFRMTGIESLDFETQAGRKVFFVSDHHIDQRRQFPVDLLGPGLSSDRFPERISIVQDHMK